MRFLVCLFASFLLLFSTISLALGSASITINGENNMVKQNFKKVTASHILVNTKEEADSIKTNLDNGANFEKMAQEKSTCLSASIGGNLGTFGEGEMVPLFEETAFNLPIGKISEPIHTQFGWHIIKVYDKK